MGNSNSRRADRLLRRSRVSIARAAQSHLQCPRCCNALIAPPNSAAFHCPCGMLFETIISTRRGASASLNRTEDASMRLLMCVHCGRAGMCPRVLSSDSVLLCPCGSFILGPAQWLTLMADHECELVGDVLPLLTFKTGNQGEASSHEQLQCRICLGDYEENEELMLLPCFHRFHKECIDEWIHTRGACPLCNSDIKDLLSRQQKLHSASHDTACA